MTKRKALSFLVLLLCSVVLFAGGGKETSAKEEESANLGDYRDLTADVAVASALTDQTISIGYGTTIETLTPFRPDTARNAPYMILLYETLAVISADGDLLPYAAKGWVTEDDGYSYDIELWDNITDSQGNHIMASDLVWFFNEAKARATKPIFNKIDHAEVIDDYHFMVYLNTNMVGAFESLMGTDIMVMSEKAFKESSDEFGLRCVSTSPYVVTEFVPGVSIAYERRDDYWQDISNLPEMVIPVAKYVNFKCIPEAFQLGVALETGAVDAVVDIAASTGSQFVGNPAYEVDLSPGPKGWQLFFSGDESSILADNVALRQAICYAIDADGLVAAFASGFGTQMWDIGSPKQLGFNPRWQQEGYYQYDPEKAKELLKEAGYNGETLILLGTSSASASRLTQLIQNYCRAVGINVELKTLDMALYSAIQTDGSQYDMKINTVGGTSLANQWSICFDPTGYQKGDGTSRKDLVLGDMLYETWAVSGWTEENIDAVHYYLIDNCYAYGLVSPQIISIWKKDLNLKKLVKGGVSGYVMLPASQFDR